MQRTGAAQLVRNGKTGAVLVPVDKYLYGMSNNNSTAVTGASYAQQTNPSTYSQKWTDQGGRGRLFDVLLSPIQFVPNLPSNPTAIAVADFDATFTAALDSGFFQSFHTLSSNVNAIGKIMLNADQPSWCDLGSGHAWEPSAVVNLEINASGANNYGYKYVAHRRDGSGTDSGRRLFGRSFLGALQRWLNQTCPYASDGSTPTAYLSGKTNNHHTRADHLDIIHYNWGIQGPTRNEIVEGYEGSANLESGSSYTVTSITDGTIVVSGFASGQLPNYTGNPFVFVVKLSDISNPHTYEYRLCTAYDGSGTITVADHAFTGGTDATKNGCGWAFTTKNTSYWSAIGPSCKLQLLKKGSANWIGTPGAAGTYVLSHMLSSSTAADLDPGHRNGIWPIGEVNYAARQDLWTTGNTNVTVIRDPDGSHGTVWQTTTTLTSEQDSLDAAAYGFVRGLLDLEEFFPTKHVGIYAGSFYNSTGMHMSDNISTTGSPTRGTFDTGPSDKIIQWFTKTRTPLKCLLGFTDMKAYVPSTGRGDAFDYPTAAATAAGAFSTNTAAQANGLWNWNDGGGRCACQFKGSGTVGSSLSNGMDFIRTIVDSFTYWNMHYVEFGGRTKPVISASHVGGSTNTEIKIDTTTGAYIPANDITILHSGVAADAPVSNPTYQSEALYGVDINGTPTATYNSSVSHMYLAAKLDALYLAQ